MKLLAFLAHNAPDIPDWFVVDFRPEPVVPAPLETVYGLPSRHVYNSYFGYFCESDFSWQKYDRIAEKMVDISDSIPPDYKSGVELHQHLLNEQTELLTIWTREFNELRYFSWRIHYAKELLSTLKAVEAKDGKDLPGPTLSFEIHA